MTNLVHSIHPRIREIFFNKVEFFRQGANRSNLISLPQQQLGAIEKVTKIKTDVKVGIGKSNTCV